MKIYMGIYYGAVRELLGDRLHFGFQHSEIKDAPLGRLITVFGKTCANTELVDDLRSVVKHRDSAAHQAFLCLYGEKPDPEAFSRMIDENIKLATQLTELLPRVHNEAVKVVAVLDAEKKKSTSAGEAV